jgi:hypothetical protein
MTKVQQHDIINDILIIIFYLIYFGKEPQYIKEKIYFLSHSKFSIDDIINVVLTINIFAKKKFNKKHFNILRYFLLKQKTINE